VAASGVRVEPNPLAGALVVGQRLVGFPGLAEVRGEVPEVLGFVGGKAVGAFREEGDDAVPVASFGANREVVVAAGSQRAPALGADLGEACGQGAALAALVVADGGGRQG
jgi:hypothetical protein